MRRESVAEWAGNVIACSEARHARCLASAAGRARASTYLATLSFSHSHVPVDAWPSCVHKCRHTYIQAYIYILTALSLSCMCAWLTNPAFSYSCTCRRGPIAYTYMQTYIRSYIQQYIFVYTPMDRKFQPTTWKVRFHTSFEFAIIQLDERREISLTIPLDRKFPPTAYNVKFHISFKMISPLLMRGARYQVPVPWTESFHRLHKK